MTEPISVLIVGDPLAGMVGRMASLMTHHNVQVTIVDEISNGELCGMQYDTIFHEEAGLLDMDLEMIRSLVNASDVPFIEIDTFDCLVSAPIVKPSRAQKLWDAKGRNW